MQKIDAVREILLRIGLKPGSALETGIQSDTGTAEDLLDQEELAVQGRGWHYNTLRDYELSPVLYEFDNAAWTDATKTLTQAGKFADATAGQTIEITTGAVLGQYTVASKVSDNAVTLEEDISSGGDIASGIAGIAINNRIALPSDTIRVDTDAASARYDFTQSGGRMYDLTENTDMFSSSYRFTLVVRKEFGCIPYEIRRYIMLRAALRFAEMRKAEQMPAIRRDLDESRRRALRMNGRLSNANVFDRPESAQVRGFRARIGSGIIADERFGV